MRIACVNYQAVSLYHDQGWSKERLSQYYNPCGVAEEVRVFAYEDTDWQVSDTVHVDGWNDVVRLVDSIREYDPDIIRCYEANYPFCIIALRVANAFGIPSYLSLHDRRKEIVDELKNYTVITAYNYGLKRSVSVRLGREVELQLNGIDENVFKPGVYPSENHDKFHVFTVGRDDPVKNIPDMVKATGILDESLGGDKIVHIIAGPGLGNMGKRSVHFFTGSTDEADIVRYLNWCDCLFMVQTVPDLGMAQTEPLFVGKPVVVPFESDGGSSILDENMARFVPIGMVHSPEYMANVLYDCLTSKFDPEYIRNFAIEHFSASICRRKEADRYCRFSSRKAML